MLIVVGAGRAGKTAFVRALCELPFKHTDSTAGVATAKLETTCLHGWKKMEGSDFEKVTQGA